MIISTLQEWPQIPPVLLMTSTQVSLWKYWKINHPKPLVEFVYNTTQAKKPKENDKSIIKIDLQNKVNKAKNAEIKENNEIKEIKEGKDKEENKPR
jgi:hypothetical protein